MRHKSQAAGAGTSRTQVSVLASGSPAFPPSPTRPTSSLTNPIGSNAARAMLRASRMACRSTLPMRQQRKLLPLSDTHTCPHGRSAQVRDSPCPPPSRGRIHHEQTAWFVSVRCGRTWGGASTMGCEPRPKVRHRRMSGPKQQKPMPMRAVARCDCRIHRNKRAALRSPPAYRL